MSGAAPMFRKSELSLSTRLAGLVRDPRGVSAVEFAMILPLMATMYFGTAEVSQGVSADRKVTLTARTAADLTSQSSSLTAANVTDILNASSTIMYPFSTSNLRLTISCINISASNVATVAWSRTLNGTARTTGSTVTMPTALKIASSAMTFAEVSYSYRPLVGYVITGTLTLTDNIYMRTRLTDTCPSLS